MGGSSGPYQSSREEERNALIESQMAKIPETSVCLGDLRWAVYADARLSRGGTSLAFAHFLGSGFLYPSRYLWDPFRRAEAGA